jgi:hydroxymethylpyrimidine pyrophosphatase-like HAD family hydrolase
MSPFLHLIAELGTLSEQDPAEKGLSKLEAHLTAHPEITFTLVTRGSLHQALQKLGVFGQLLIQHIIAEAGTSIYHRRENGAWYEDAEYRTWAEAHWSTRALEQLVEWGGVAGAERTLGGFSSRHVIFELISGKESAQVFEELKARMELISLKGNLVQSGNLLEVTPIGVDRGTAAEFLHAKFPKTCPLMVCGSTELNLNLFQHADYPVLMADSPLDFETPGIPRERIYRTVNTGPEGILGALIQFEFNHLAVGKER